ncbi:cytochrome P450 [Talaromyces proteolyticus]|uniref:Cytochrome P450 n=1 Tax=Talaromyces proteolyticus TaxID=1131652 RepID=A0AAD4PUJ5_9EURO|nr:cytochrome P450 [Talaromyces proteolyticus]KAH8695171.1 cytochrome P450 [Talaromyces proteolyticus]
MLLNDTLTFLPSSLPGVVIICASLTTLLAIVITGYAIYQISFHPLAQYPEPLLGKLTSLWSVYHAFRGDRHLAIFELHQRYGTVVRIGPHHISINSASALGPIYGHGANVQKSTLYASFYGNNLLTAVDKKTHGRKKRVMSSAFSDQALRNMEPHILSAIRDWCSALGKNYEDSALKGHGHWSTCVVFDALGEVCFGRSFESSCSDENHFFFALMSLNMYIINIVGQMPILRSLGVEPYLRRGTAANRQRQVAFAGKQLRTRLEADKSGTNRRDIIYYLLRAQDPETGKGYSDSELISEVTMLLGAGTDTASTALAATFYYLTRHPAILARVTGEIRSTFPDLESIVLGPLMQQMPYLRACIEEAMRLSPPLPTLLPRQVLEGGLHIDQYFFQAGTIIGVPIYALHHTGKYFEQPFTYDPNRWLLRDSEHREGALRNGWLGFSAVGAGGRDGEYKIRDHFAAGKEGPVLQFQRRI